MWLVYDMVEHNNNDTGIPVLSLWSEAFPQICCFRLLFYLIYTDNIRNGMFFFVLTHFLCQAICTQRTRRIVGSMNMGYIVSDTARNRTHNLLIKCYNIVWLSDSFKNLFVKHRLYEDNMQSIGFFMLSMQPHNSHFEQNLWKKK